MTGAAAKQLVPKFTKLPKTLYRIQARLPVKLHDYDTQMAKGRASFDLKIQEDGMVHPSHGDEWIGPNGMSLHPPTDTMLGILEDLKGEPTIFRLNEGMQLPDNLIVLHERGDHWSLQTREPTTLESLNETLTEIFSKANSGTVPRTDGRLGRSAQLNKRRSVTRPIYTKFKWQIELHWNSTKQR